MNEKKMCKLVLYVGTFKQLSIPNYSEKWHSEHLHLDFVFFLLIDSQQIDSSG